VSIYKPCDIRGHAATELTPELYHRWGSILGSRVEPLAKFVVGGDVRGSTPRFLSALVEGLCEAGVDVVNLGQLPTPMIYHAKRRLKAAGCSVVTASHNPAEINGLKWMIADRPPTPEDVASLRHLTEASAGPCPERKRTRARALDVSFDYVACLQETWVDALGAQCHVVLDAMYGCWALRARRYLQAIFPQSLFSTIHDAPDKTFAGQAPDCSRSELLDELCEAVYRERAHVGIAFDGDGDRVAFVDNGGAALTAEEAVWMLLHSFGPQMSGQRFVYDVKFSDQASQAARRLGAEPLAERSGHAFIRRRMLDTDALVGAEISGHYFYRDLYGGDDGLYSACRMIAYLAQENQPLADLRRQCPPIYMTPDLRLALPAGQQQQVIEQVRRAWAEFPQSTLDGVRIDTPAGWALVRSSVTEPALTFRFESIDWAALDDLVHRFCLSLPEVGEELWARYETAMGYVCGQENVGE